jgi:hypothetical protein
MSENTGGPAFPHIKEVKKENGNTNSIEWFPGMTLRDYFAAKSIYFLSASGIDAPGYIAVKAYEIADAMLKEREK